VNGTIDEHAYELGALDTSLPFLELKRGSDVNDRARAADRDPDFSRLPVGDARSGIRRSQV
jgi:hypothetical protein